MDTVYPRSPHVRAVQIWLYAIAALVLFMVALGGATRLTGSGLSIPEWQPIAGTLPPLSAADWQDAFDKYRQTTQYRLVNKGMSLEAFKTIYWWEWSHRFLGRLIGFAFTGPFLWFWARGRLPHGLAVKLCGVLTLGAAQGVLGWAMVQSGLAGRIDVSHYRLALHLTLAVSVVGLLLWLALDAGRAEPRWRMPSSRSWAARVLVILILVQIVFGALVAGLKAGLVYTTWPLMDGRPIPGGLWTLEPWYLNPFENVTLVQFQHRTMAYVLLAFALWHVWSVRADAKLARSAAAVAAALTLQTGLGIWTLVTAMGEIPIVPALAHQVNAVVVFGLAVRHVFRAAERTEWTKGGGAGGA
ncbi:MAG: COX15/CtaA family protein [Hyphomicrobiaceae bacterium]